MKSIELLQSQCARLILAAFLFLQLAAVADAQSTNKLANPTKPVWNDVDKAYIREHYTKYEYNIPMRDGVKLFVLAYAPKDISEPYPILMTRTPYGNRPYGEDAGGSLGWPFVHHGREKFIFVSEDVRGRYGSKGQFVDMRPENESHSGTNDVDESTDTYDTIDWLVKHVPNNNGKVGMIGVSYPGFYTAAGLINSHPALKCASPQAPIADWFMGDDWHHHGVLYLQHAFRFLAGFGQKLDDPMRDSPKPFDFKTPDGYEFYLNLGPLANADKQYFHGKIEYWDEMMDHGNYDEFWQARNLRPHLKNVHAAVMTVGGWYDAEDLFGTLGVFRSVERLNPGIKNNILVMGPWPHGGWVNGDGEHLGNVHFDANNSEFYFENIELPFLKHFLKGDTNYNMPKAYVFETGTAQWRKYDSWPPKNARPKQLYFHSGGKLSFQPPANEADEFDEYVSDPAKPVPSSANYSIRMFPEHMIDDQRFVASRTDVLFYKSDVLEEDVTIAGPVEASLHVSTTGTDSDFIVKLIDVYSPDYPNSEANPPGVEMGGYQQLVRGEAFRGKFRNSLTKPEPFEPGKVEKIEYTMPDVNHTFRKGHRIMVQVQSTWFPLADRNPQTFCDINHARAEDFRKATERVCHSANASSYVTVQVLEMMRATLDPRYEGYFERFNRGQYFEAHEVLEKLWMHDRAGGNAAFYKGLIQLAGAFVHLQKDHLHPAAALLKLARANLAPYTGTHERLPIPVVLKLIDDWLARLEDGSSPPNPIQRELLPRLRLEETDDGKPSP